MKPAVQCEAVGDRSHAEFTDPVIDVVAAGFTVGRAGAAPVGEIRSGQIGRATEQLGQDRGDGFDHVLRRLARCHGTGLRRHAVEQCGNPVVPVGGQLAAHAPCELGREFGIGRTVSGETLLPGVLGGFSARARVPAGVYIVRDFERGKRPFELATGVDDLAGAERGTVHVVCAALVRRTEADHRLAADQGRSSSLRLGDPDGRFDRVHIVTVAVRYHTPAVGLETLRRVVGKPWLTWPSIEMSLSS
jgi:hypothetical protein